MMTLSDLATHAARGNRHAARLMARHRARQAAQHAAAGDAYRARAALAMAHHPPSLRRAGAGWHSTLTEQT